jgi:hypothetical protein
VSAQGAGGQSLFIVPAYGLIVSFTENNNQTPIAGPWIFEKVILPALE